ncbi:MAG: lipopolysaccharide biosynthesis protein [Geobacteraceae bacterium GWC2_53_11]|nr:MAG: lipopolysaccharide biosynthesis protein [Geobacteraceae bacterium GWC2_53_11]
MNERENIRPEIEAEEEINLLELLRVVVRNLPLIAKITAGAVLLSVLYSLSLKNIYTAKATLLPPQKDSGGGAAALLASMGGGLAGLAGGLGGSADLYLEILKSRSVADAVIKRLDLHTELKSKNADNTRKRLQGLVKFQAGKNGIITITADYKDPAKAALLANTFIDELQKKSLQLNLTKASTERSFLEKRLTVVKQDLKTAEEEMRSFQEKNKTIKADSQAAAAIEGIARLRAEIVSKEVQLAALRNSMTDESSEVSTLLAGISRLKKQLASMSGSGDGGGVIPSVGSAPGIGVEYVRRLRELKTQEALFEQLTKQYELAKISEARDSSSLQVLDDAVAPLRKSKPKRSMIVILATVTAFFGSIFLVFIKEYLAKLSPEDGAIMTDMKDTLKGMLRRKKAI